MALPMLTLKQALDILLLKQFCKPIIRILAQIQQVLLRQRRNGGQQFLDISQYRFFNKVFTLILSVCKGHQFQTTVAVCK